MINVNSGNAMQHNSRALFSTIFTVFSDSSGGSPSLTRNIYQKNVKVN